ncbi:steroid 21-hydroxylase [Latimeria chalumnae]|uniref:steroid 21-hydroxylase n=1 Tax=Latimeria chalumnae TaxID=7897 RepID=UPI0006D8EA36|nr:PREDICTED: steroid 21-hydroxylase [Latimeria chalumnae]|eukprot:XP_014347016.1 PREDICTED: steroid 21-hydroxylase [Latimeria chalumnae]
MTPALWILLSILIAVKALLRWRTAVEPSNPGAALPGPTGLPLVGNLLDLKKPELPVHLAELAKRFGPVYRLRFGCQTLVVLNSTEVIREALVRKWADFAGRPHTFTGEAISFGGKDLSLGDYTPTWKIQRKLVYASLQHCFKTNLEAVVTGEARKLCEEFRNSCGISLDPAHDFSMHVCNIICSLAFRTTFEKDDKDFLEIHACLDEIVQRWGSPSIGALDSFPILRKFPNAAWKSMLAVVQKRDSIVRRYLKQHKDTFQTQEVRDITDTLIKFLRDKEQEEGSSVKGAEEFSEEHVHMAIVDLFVGGTETTASWLAWAVAFLVHRPEVQDRIYSEICEVIGVERLPVYADRDRLPFLNATITEVLRLRPVAPLAIPHATTKDTSVAGYFIPKGVTVIPNLYGAHHDESKWRDPTHFRPERFADATNPRKAAQGIIPFSAGARVCLGETVAKVELFIFTAFLLREFKFLPPDSGELPDLKGNYGIVLKPKPYTVKITPRATLHADS